MNKNNTNFRQKLISLTRQYFSSHTFQEVETNYLVDYPPPEPTIVPFQTQKLPAKTIHYLTASPEIQLKHYLAKTKSSCFTLAHCFRNLEAEGPHHLSEFLMLEWYEVGKNHQSTIELCQDYLLATLSSLHTNPPTNKRLVVDYQNITIDLSLPWPQLSLRDLFTRHCNHDLTHLLADPKFGEADFNQLFLNNIEPKLPINRPVFVTNYPTRFSSFAKPLAQTKQLASTNHQPPDTSYCERFELYFAGIELANGNTEDTTKPFPIPACSGCGLGLDRLTMFLVNTSKLTNTTPQDCF